jgi:predicted pyridoxine 5'-phosphate oxidase superfamily flavin-nucleotide-binding protein
VEYHEGSRELQDAFDTRRLADRVNDRKVHPEITEEDRAFIEAVDCFFLATADEEGRPTCSYKGGDPGFVRVLRPDALAFPGYDGNGMYLSMGNVLRNPEVGLLFIDFERGRRLRVQGTATLERGGELLATWPGAQLAVVVRPTAVFPNCPRYLHRRALVERSAYVPRRGVKPPVPGWKRSDWAHDVLPAGDPARD